MKSKKVKENKAPKMNKVSFFLNVLKFRGRYSVSNPYADELTATESGGVTEGYVTTIPIEFVDVI